MSVLSVFVYHVLASGLLRVNCWWQVFF